MYLWASFPLVCDCTRLLLFPLLLLDHQQTPVYSKHDSKHIHCTLRPEFIFALLLSDCLIVSWSVSLCPSTSIHSPVSLSYPVILLQNCSHLVPHSVLFHAFISPSVSQAHSLANLPSLYFTQLQNIDWKGKMSPTPFVLMLL